jgi:pimeloyl-ACP methyl ester carboxylesterase
MGNAMKYRRALVLAGGLAMAGAPAAQGADTSPHKVQFVTVEKGVRLEVLDWGGSGRPLIFLAGLGATAHDFDQFALRFTAHHHVYGITRRGFGASSRPKLTAANYAATRLGDDVLAVMDALKIARPVLAGHSIAGSELSAIGTRYPDKVAGLIYMDAGYIYAFDTPGIMPLFLDLDLQQTRARVDRLAQPDLPPAVAKTEIDALQDMNLPQMTFDLQLAKIYMAGASPPPGTAPDAETAISWGLQKHGSSKAPVLAIYAYPRKLPPHPSDAVRADYAAQDAIKKRVAALFAAGNPRARVISIANSDHDVFDSNPAETGRAMNAFMDALP